MSAPVGTATVTVFRDVRDPGKNRDIRPHPVPPGTTVRDVVDAVKGDAGYVRAFHNGYEADPAANVLPGDTMTVAALPDDPLTLGTAVLTAVLGVPSFAGLTTLGTITAFTIGAILDIGILTGAGALASLLVEKPRVPDQPISGTYNRQGMVTSRAEGSVQPVPFGRIKCPGQIISSRVMHVAGNASQYGSHSATRGNLRQLTLVSFGEGPGKSIGGQTSDLDHRWFSTQQGQSINYHPHLKVPAVSTDPYTPIRDAASRQRIAFKLFIPLTVTPDVILSIVRLMLFRVGDLAGYKVRVTVQSGGASPSGVDLLTPIEVDANSVFRATSPSKGYLAASPITFGIPEISLGAPSIGFWIVVDGTFPVSATNYLCMMSHLIGNQGLVAWDGATWSALPSPFYYFPNAEALGSPLQWLGTGVKINDNDLANFTASGNISLRLGTSGQKAIPGLGDVVRQTLVGAALTPNKALTASTNEEVDAVSLLVTFTGGWQHPQKNIPLAFDVDIRCRAQGASTWPVSFRHHEAPFMAAPGHTILIHIPFPVGSKTPAGSLNHQKVEIEMTYATTVAPIAPAEWTLIQEIQSRQAQSYPYNIIVALETDVATQGSALQNVTAILEGNYCWVFDNSGATRTYQYITNPAWQALKWILNQRFGAGNKLTLGNVDIDSFEEWADFCDEMVDDGTGTNTQHKRWETGVNIDVEKAHWEHAKIFAAASRTKLYRVGNVIRAKPQKAATTIAQLFTMGNIIEDTFKIEWFGTKKRPNHVFVDFLDEALDFSWNSAPDEDETARIDDPSLVEHMEVLGVTNLTRAKELARYYTALVKALTTAIEFEASIDAVAVEPYDVFAFAHDMPWAHQASGRIAADSASGTTVKFDRTITIAPATTYKVSVRTVGTGQFVKQERTINHAAGTYVAGTAIGVDPSWDAGDWPKGPDPTTGRGGDVYAFGEESSTKKHVYLYQAVTVEFTSERRKRIRAINYDATVYGEVKHDLRTTRVYPVRLQHTPLDIPPAPRNLRLTKMASGYGPRQSTTTMRAVWEAAVWPFNYRVNVFIRDVTLGETLFGDPHDSTNANFYIFGRGLTVGHTYAVAVAPMAPGTLQYHNPNSQHAAHATLTLEYAADKPPVLTGF